MCINRPLPAGEEHQLDYASTGRTVRGETQIRQARSQCASTGRLVRWGAQLRQARSKCASTGRHSSTSHFSEGGGLGKTLKCTNRGADLEPKRVTLRLLRYDSPLVVVSFPVPPRRDPRPWATGLPVTEEGGARRGGRRGRGGEKRNPAQRWKRVHPHTYIPALALPDRPLHGPSYKMYMRG